jgi:3-deoxy-D-manno-octulosonate 8-phosphate phosphatase (KDO 8-P phosphatase)
MDVDGVLTDGTVSLDGEGREIKRVSFADIMGVSIGQRAGLFFALVTGESGPTLDQIAAKFGIEEIYENCKDKAAAVRDFAARHDLNLADICYIGDDVNDVSALEICGLSVTPANAHPVAAGSATVVTANSGGSGSVREVVDALLGGGWPGVTFAQRGRRHGDLQAVE